MDFYFWKNNIGLKADIKEGNVVLSEDGFLSVSNKPTQYSVYVDELRSSVSLIIPKSDYRGRLYKLFESDCVTLSAEWFDNYFKTDTLGYLSNISPEEYRRLWGAGFKDHLKTLGFVKQNKIPDKGDVIYYGRPNHIGICLGDNKILHHLPRKYSCIDEIDPTKLGDVYGKTAKY